MENPIKMDDSYFWKHPHRNISIHHPAQLRCFRILLLGTLQILRSSWRFEPSGKLGGATFPWRIHGGDCIFTDPWMVDFYGKCREIMGHIPYMDAMGSWSLSEVIRQTPQSSAENMTIDADRELVTSWWFFTIHLKNMRKSLDHFPTNRSENLKQLKPPPR